MTYQLKDRNFHHTLIKIRRLVFDDLDRHNLVRLHVLAFHHLTECPLTKNVKDEIFAMDSDVSPHDR